MVEKSDFNENPVVSLDLDLDFGFVNKLMILNFNYSIILPHRSLYREGAINMSRGGVPIIILNSDRSTGSP